MEKTLEEKITHATKRIQHHLDQSSEWENKMVQCQDECEKARTRTYFHSEKAGEWEERLTLFKRLQEKELGYTNAINKLNHIISVLDGLPQKFQGPVFRMLMDKKWRHETSLTHEEKELLSILWRINDEKDS